MDAAENLCPVEKLIDAGRDRNNRHPYLVPLLASNGKTIGIFVRQLEQRVLQIWTADGKHKLREEPAVSSAGYVEREKSRLIQLRDGDFFSGNELVWVPTNVERPVWRFNLQPLPRSPARHQWPSRRRAWRTTISSSRATRAGCLYSLLLN